MRRKALNEKTIILLCIGAAVLARLLYILWMPVVDFAQYDIGSVFLDENVMTGHEGYIFYLVKYHHLPDFDPTLVYQFNHPPIHHILCALWVGFVSLFTDNFKVWEESIQFISLLYSVVTLIGVRGICKELNLNLTGTATTLLLIGFQPTLIMTAGSINNDGIGLMFQVLSVWFFLRWYHKRNYAEILKLALAIAFGMLSKLSAGLIAVPIGIAFLFLFINEWKEAKKFPGTLLKQYLAFGIVCVPLGLSWVLRCYIKYDMPFTYIAYLPDTSPQYVGMYSFKERMLFPNLVTLAKNLMHGSIGMGENIWVQLARTSALGECDLSLFPMWGKLLCMAMLCVNFALALWATIDMAIVLVNKKKTFICTDQVFRILFLGGWLTLMYSYLSFANTYPHECSMNFRYVQLLFLFPAVCMGLKTERSGNVRNRIFQPVIVLYAVFSIAIIVLWSMNA